MKFVDLDITTAAAQAGESTGTTGSSEPAPPAGQILGSPGPTGHSLHRPSRILLVGEATEELGGLCKRLREEGGEVTVAENGRLGVDYALSARSSGRSFDLIIMNMDVPVLDGYSATHLLRGHGHMGPIVGVTPDDLAETRERCLAAGCDEHFTAPLSCERLMALAEDWVIQHEPAAPTNHTLPRVLISQYGHDPERLPEIEQFIAGLPMIIQALRRSMEQHDLLLLAALAHQLTGAAKGYGFPEISTLAACIEQVVEVSPRVEVLQRLTTDLVTLCHRARATT